MCRSQWLSLQVILLSACVIFVRSDCIWYGVAQHDHDYPRYKAYNGTGKRLPGDASYDLLSELCPTYANGRDSPVCCDGEQLGIFRNSSKLAYDMLRRCPSCWSNFRMVFCAMTCAPDQSDFLEPTIKNVQVESVQYYLTNHVAGSFFNSCKDVTFGNARAIDAICSSTSCTVDAFLKALGTGAQSPFPIFFVRPPAGAGSSDHQIFFNGTVYACNESVPKRGKDVGGHACSCSDCELSCATPTPPPPVEPITILGVDVWTFSAFLVFALLVLAFAAYEISSRVYPRRQPHALLVDDSLEARAPQDTDGDDRAHLLPETSQTSCIVRIRASMEYYMTLAFFSLGRSVARHPYLVLLATTVVSTVLCCGLVCFQVTTNPVELWSAPTSQYRVEKTYFDQNFQPFYRTEQLIIRPVNQSCFKHKNIDPLPGTACFGAALKKDFLLKIFELQNELLEVQAYSESLNENVTLHDICFKPLAPDNFECAVTSPVEYFQNNLTLFNLIREDEFEYPLGDYLEHLLFCADSPTSPYSSPLDPSAGCLGTSGMPILPIVALASFDGKNYNLSKAVVMTFLVENDADPKSVRVKRAEAWEAAYLEHVKEWAKLNEANITVAYQAERSVEDEINRQSKADVATVLLSYLVMFVYVSIFLASYRSCRTVFVDLRITLGLGGVLMVIISVVSAVGIFSYAGVPATLIIIEVIPFLVLAVGVDNIFILVHDFEFDREEADKIMLEAQEQVVASRQALRDPTVGGDGDDLDQVLRSSAQMAGVVRSLVETQVARTLGRVGPSLLLTGLTEAVAFFCGSLTSMPAVKMFALYAGVALLFNLVLQLTAFVALLTLDERRRAVERFDVFCCFGLKTAQMTVGGFQGMPTEGESSLDLAVGSPSRMKATLNGDQADTHSLSLNSNVFDEIQLNGGLGQSRSAAAGKDGRDMPWLHRAIAHGLTPFLLSGWVRPLVMLISLAWLCVAVALVPNTLRVGLDQRLSMPTDSYMQAYFDALAHDLRVGPPVYFVVTRGHDYLGVQGQNEICSGFDCPTDSLLSSITVASRLPSYSRISTPASSWLDDYFDWIDPEGSPFCCRVYRNATSHFCPDSEPDDACVTCPVKLVDNRPNVDDFMRYLPFYLSQNPGIKCPKGGKAAYRAGVKLEENDTVIGPTYFMSYHSVLQTPSDFTDAVRASRRLADSVNARWKVNGSRPVDDSTVPGTNTVYPYSVFYVFYEQYLDIVKEAFIHLSVCLAAVIVVTFLLLGLNLMATVVVLLGVLYILVSLLALMGLWGITLNAISLVNLVVTIGIAVEFCSHIVRAFTVSAALTRLERAKAALSDMGSSILRGITLTKLGGIIVLAFSQSQLFRVFYFRMYLGIIVFGAITGLLVLPVFLSYLGPGLNKALADKYGNRALRRF